MRIALVNTNRIKPPVGPLGLEYLAEALNAAGYAVEILDLCWADDWESSLRDFFSKKSLDLIGVTLRNTDDCVFPSRQSFLGEFADVADKIRSLTDAKIIVGGVGFSVMPEEVLRLCRADAGVWGDGEFVFVEIARRIDEGKGWFDLPNLIWSSDGECHRNPPWAQSLKELPRMGRRWFDNQRYFQEGGQAGIETKRGCPGRCIYCADPVAKGKMTRTRPPSAVVDELEALLQQGIDHIHTCDSEFNLPPEHAAEVCRETIRRGLGGKLRWHAYCSPVPFSPELAGLMKEAGCMGINFGVDSGDDRMLKKLRRDFTSEDVLNTARFCQEKGITVMFDLLLGAPGETRESIVRTIELMKRSGADRVGVALGVRVYPGTEMAALIKRSKLDRGLTGGADPSKPLFFLEPEIAPFASRLLDELIGDDRTFFFFNPADPDRNYNYNDNQRLVEAIRRGHRGAYWDILRRVLS